ncbi:hypothetical protein KEM48_002716 [Puccinia striiformis f. sp. tritici PST-130]|nr:hypothetical protein KEM48_002716 [Puccinia striiformis f. sp. tritici PST-130]
MCIRTTGIHEIQTSEVGAEKAGGIIGTDLIDRPASHRDLRSRPKDEVRPASDDEKGSSSDDESVSSSDDEAESPSDDEDLTSVVRGPPRGPMEILYKTFEALPCCQIRNSLGSWSILYLVGR